MKSHITKVCVVTTTRAEYGLLKPLMNEIRQNELDFCLQLVVSGTHLLSEYGYTYLEIEKDGFMIDERVDMLVGGDSSSSVSKSLGLIISGMSDAFRRLQPDCLVLLGDRYEILGVAACAALFNIPVIHLHGGEQTMGAIDDSIRHAVTKLSHVHFTSTESYRQRVIQLGEQPDWVFNVGAIGMDNINKNILSKNELAESLALALDKPYFLVTYHPVTLESRSVEEEIDSLFEALLEIEGTQSIVTLANADVGGSRINKRIRDWSDKFKDRFHAFPSLGQVRYLSAMKYCLAVIGNSSSGIIEAPAMKVPTVNIGTRQQGRVLADSVIQVDGDRVSIQLALRKTMEVGFREGLANTTNPYGTEGVAKKIVDVLKNISDWRALTKKEFFDLDCSKVNN